MTLKKVMREEKFFFFVAGRRQHVRKRDLEFHVGFANGRLELEGFKRF